MTTENLNNENPEVKTDQENEVVPEVKPVSPTEIAARDSGWVPKEDWVASGKDPDEWRSAKEYQERGELFEEIHKLKESNKKTSAAFKVLVEHHKKVRETAVAEALAKLRAEKKEALANHEIERVEAIDEHIDRVRAGAIPEPQIDLPEVEAGPTPAFKKWHKQNDWYELEGDDEASRYADVVGIKYKKDNPNASENDLLAHVESKVARRFPELFENPNSKRASEVNPPAGTKSDGGTYKLTDQEERACKMFVEQGIMSRKEYIEELKRTR